SRQVSAVPFRVAVNRPEAPSFVPFGIGFSWPMLSAALSLNVVRGAGLAASPIDAKTRAPTTNVSENSASVFLTIVSSSRVLPPRRSPKCAFPAQICGKGSVSIRPASTVGTPVHEPQGLPALVDRAGLVVDEAVVEPDALHGLEREIAGYRGGLLRPR